MLTEPDDKPSHRMMARTGFAASRVLLGAEKTHPHHLPFSPPTRGRCNIVHKNRATFPNRAGRLSRLLGGERADRGAG
jgi:hypothetical protein